MTNGRQIWYTVFGGIYPSSFEICLKGWHPLEEDIQSYKEQADQRLYYRFDAGVGAFFERSRRRYRGRVDSPSICRPKMDSCGDWFLVRIYDV